MFDVTTSNILHMGVLEAYTDWGSWWLKAFVLTVLLRKVDGAQ